MNIIKSFKNSFVYKYIAYYTHKLCVWIDPKIEMNRCYATSYGGKINYFQPKNLIEKIYWLQLYSDTSLWTLCADKYKARNYISECGYADFLPKLYAKWDNPDDISFDNLPDSFVIKANNGCGSVYIVNDKNKEELSKIKKMAKKWLAIPFGYSGSQLHYLSIKPCIVAEELLNNDFQDSFSPHSMVDYKVWCINGEPENIWIAYNRTKENVSMAMYDLKWVAIPQYLVNIETETYHPEVKIPEPPCLSQMLEMARVLSQPFAEVRVDFYIVNNSPIVGELSFTTGFGFFTKEYYEYLGSKIDLSKIKRIR